MGIKDIWNRLMGREAEKDSGWPQPEPREVSRITVKIEADTSQLVASIADAKAKIGGLVRKARALKKLTAHGKPSRKPKSRSQKKPARKRTRK